MSQKDHHRYYNKKLKNLARELRNNSTPAEVRLWSEILRGGKTGYQFLRQRPVLNFIADFMCKEAKLIIEIDGRSHDFEEKYHKDLKRQKELEESGFTVLRFSEKEVMNDLRNVESEILGWLHDQKQ